MFEKGIQLEKAIELEQNLNEQNLEEWTNKDKEIEEIRKNAWKLIVLELKLNVMTKGKDQVNTCWH